MRILLLISLLSLLLVHLAFAGRRSASSTLRVRKQRKSKKRGVSRRKLDDGEVKSRVFERLLQSKDSSIESNSAGRDSDESDRLINGLESLPVVSVWKLRFDDGWDEIGSEEIEVEGSDQSIVAGDVWTPGFMMLTKLDHLEFDSEFIDFVDSECLIDPMTTPIDDSSSPDSESPNAPSDQISSNSISSDSISLNTTACPSFDLMIQLVNSISTRIVFTADGSIIPFEIFATDYVGTLNNMDVESQVMDAITYLWSIEFSKSGAVNSTDLEEVEESNETRLSESMPYDTLLLNEAIQFDQIPNCRSVGCFGSHVFSKTASFWTVDAFRSDPNNSTDWDVNPIPGVGLWVQMSNEGLRSEEMSNENNKKSVNFLVQPGNLNVGPSYGTSLTIDISDGTVTDSTPIRNTEESSSVDSSLERLKSVVSATTSLRFNLVDVPWSVSLISPIGEAVLYLSYIGEETGVYNSTDEIFVVM